MKMSNAFNNTLRRLAGYSPDTVGKPAVTLQHNPAQTAQPTTLQHNPAQTAQPTPISANLPGAPANPAGERQQTTTPARSITDMEALLGPINYDQNAIRGIFDDAVRTQYSNLENEQRATEDEFYRRMYGTQNTALDTIRRSNAEAIATGASRGVQAANELSSIFGLQQQAAEESTELSRNRDALMGEREAALANNAGMAMEYADGNRLALGNLAALFHQADSAQNAQWDASALGYDAQMDSNVDWETFNSGLQDIIREGGPHLESNLRAYYDFFGIESSKDLTKDTSKTIKKEERAVRREEEGSWLDRTTGTIKDALGNFDDTVNAKIEDIAGKIYQGPPEGTPIIKDDTLETLKKIPGTIKDALGNFGDTASAKIEDIAGKISQGPSEETSAAINDTLEEVLETLKKLPGKAWSGIQGIFGK